MVQKNVSFQNMRRGMRMNCKKRKKILQSIWFEFENQVDVEGFRSKNRKKNKKARLVRKFNFSSLQTNSREPITCKYFFHNS